MSTCNLVCLLPVRNCETDLPGYFVSVSQFADAVVALDDGSTDGTRVILEKEPLVRVLLSNPRREGYQGWDDSKNRNRLLAAAESLRPRWILSLDADERIPADDAEALLGFLDDDAQAGFVYGFRLYRMIEDLDTYDKSAAIVYRLFAHRPGQRFPGARLHFTAAPTDIPRARWSETTLRIQHLAGLTAERRRKRYEKYLEADGERRYQRSYEAILDHPGDLKRWLPRDMASPVLADPDAQRRLAPQVAFERAAVPHLDPARPVLSAIVISQNDRDRIEPAMNALVNQQVDQAIEIILVNSGSDGTAEFVRERFPGVRVVHLAEPALPGRARNVGLQLARGDYVSFPGSHVVLEPESLQRRIEAHDSGYTMVTGSVLNGNQTLSGWASYFLDHSGSLPGRGSTELRQAPSHCSYRRAPLVAVGPFPEDRRTAEDTVLNQRLFELGYRALRSSRIQFVHKSPCTTPLRLARHHFERGRGLGRMLVEAALNTRRGHIRWLIWTYPRKRLALTTRNTLRWGRPNRRYLALSFPLMVMGALCAAAGALVVVIRHGPYPTERRGPAETPQRPFPGNPP